MNYKRLAYRRTIKGLIKNIYSRQCQSSKTRGHAPPTYKIEEFYNWFLLQPNFVNLYNEWVESGYEKNKRPSVDRLDDNKPYTFCNIRLVTWIVNNNKRLTDFKSGKLTHGSKPQKPVIQFNLKREKINEYHSISQAFRETGIETSAISACCLGKRKKTGNFLWEHI